MRILVTGRGKSGSWQIRGEQLGRAIGATIVPKAQDVSGFDRVIVVKRPYNGLLEVLRRSRAQVVWDVVDAWPQPAGNDWTHEPAMAWLRGTVDTIKPAGIVAPTAAMAADCAGLARTVIALPHHGCEVLRRNPIREQVERVGYVGGEQYIATWRGEIDRECRKRGWEFVVNPPQLADVDIVLGLRDQRGYPARRWKSNVKLANAQISGTPCIMAREAGYTETASGAEVWADTAEELKAGFDKLTHYEIRRDVSERLFRYAPRLKNIAAEYCAWLSQKFSCRTAPTRPGGES